MFERSFAVVIFKLEEAKGNNLNKGIISYFCKSVETLILNVLFCKVRKPESRALFLTSLVIQSWVKSFNVSGFLILHL